MDDEQNNVNGSAVSSIQHHGQSLFQSRSQGAGNFYLLCRRTINTQCEVEVEGRRNVKDDSRVTDVTALLYAWYSECSFFYYLPEYYLPLRRREPGMNQITLVLVLDGRE